MACICSALNTLAVLLVVLQGEQLAAGGLAAEGSTVVLASSDGMLAHFAADCVRCSGRAAGSIKVSWGSPGPTLLHLGCYCTLADVLSAAGLVFTDLQDCVSSSFTGVCSTAG